MSQVSQVPEVKMRSEVRDGMRIDWNAPIPVDDGIVLRADIYPPYRRGQVSGDPDLRNLRQGSRLSRKAIPCSGRRWSPIIRRFWRARPTSIRTGRPPIPSAGCRMAMPWSAWIRAAPAGLRASWTPPPRERSTTCTCASSGPATQPWSNGKVGMLGISYYATNQWRVAAKHPPHLAAIIPWEGRNDHYRDNSLSRRHSVGVPEALGEAAGGQHSVWNRREGQEEPEHRRVRRRPGTLSEEELAKNRVDAFEDLKKHPLY